jgi:competence protein ComEC
VAAPLFCTGAAIWGAVALRRRGKAPWPAALTAALAFLLWVHLPYAALPDDRLTVAAINVGKGAAHVVSFPGGRHMVIDCGSALRGDAGNNVVAPFLRGRGIRRVDVLVLTHPHEDHYGGAEVLLEQFPVAEIWIPAGVPPSAFGEAVSRRASIVRPKYGGEVFSAGGAQVIVRGTGASGEAAGANERSLLLEARYGSLSVWFPGDVEKGPAAWGRATGKGEGNRILFLPHHGSPGADPASWVRAARPSAVVSQNRNCFPEKNLLPSFESFLLENGMFAIRSDGDAVSCKQEGVFWVWKLLWRLP